MNVVYFTQLKKGKNNLWNIERSCLKSSLFYNRYVILRFLHIIDYQIYKLNKSKNVNLFFPMCFFGLI